ncbi:MAG: ATP-binding cassette domain-containing protein [Scytonema sp. RU_4_4]|nr:ATP-binding cassette domain-containing protein [Scytonema sp. RU_4_4]
MIYKSKSARDYAENYLLELKNVTFSYRNPPKLLLEDANFQLLPGEKIGIVGDNGSGKSTIAKLFLGLCKPQRGFIRLFGEEVSWGNHYPMLGYIGDPSYNPGGLGLPTNVLVGDLVDCFKKLWSNSIQDSSLELEDRLNLPLLYKNDIGVLSKGERMRVMAFLALSKQPKLLIADEATEGLDKESKKIILSELKRAFERSEFGMVWISHRHHEIAILVDQVYELTSCKLKKHSLGNFNCEVETEFKTETYNNLSYEAFQEVFGEVFTNSLVSNFNIKGTRKTQTE